MEIYKRDVKLIQAALEGQKEAVRMISGSFGLVVSPSGEFFRLYGDKVPKGYRATSFGYDEEGFLLPQYWSLPIINENGINFPREGK